MMIDAEIRALGIVIVGSAYCISIVLTGLYAHSRSLNGRAIWAVVLSIASMGLAFSTWVVQSEGTATQVGVTLNVACLAAAVLASIFLAWALFST